MASFSLTLMKGQRQCVISTVPPLLLFLDLAYRFPEQLLEIVFWISCALRRYFRAGNSRATLVI